MVLAGFWVVLDGLGGFWVVLAVVFGCVSLVLLGWLVEVNCEALGGAKRLICLTKTTGT